MRRPKHRHHPHIWWRERQRAEKAGRKRWCGRPLTMGEFVGRYTNAARTPALLTLDEMTALAAEVWNSALPLADYYGNPAGTLVYSGLVPVEEDRPRVWR